ncbi:MAG: GNAT family N-acetyltransferase [Acidimicrobiia bacterium]|jgi:RimJ/RimL family protein N-acetyltransferase
MSGAPLAFVLHATRVSVRGADTIDPFVPGPGIDLVVERRADTRAIGTVGVRVEPDEDTLEVSVALDVEARGQGYGTEALGLVVEHALVERGFVRVVAFARSDDERTQHLLERVGLRYVALDGDDLLYLCRADARSPRDAAS